MKFWKIFILFFTILFFAPYSVAKFEYDDPLNLVNDPKIQQHYYTYNNTKMLYSETYENEERYGKPTILLILHSGVQRSELHPLKHLTNPGFQSLIRYVRKHKTKVLIIAPQYPPAANRADKDVYPYPQKYNDLVMQLYKDKIKEYNIPKDRLFVVATCVGGIALNDILNQHQDLFRKAVFVASKTIDAEKFEPGKFKTEIYLVQGDRDSIKTKLQLMKILENKSIKATLKILKNTNHLESLKMDVGYPDYMWKWLFKYEYNSFFDFLKDLIKRILYIFVH